MMDLDIHICFQLLFISNLLKQTKEQKEEQ